MECPKCHNPMERINDIVIGRYECWLCGKIIYDPITPDMSSLIDMQEQSVCNYCTKIFYSDERNQKYCPVCRLIRKKAKPDFSRIKEEQKEAIKSLEKFLSIEELIQLLAQEPNKSLLSDIDLTPVEELMHELAGQGEFSDGYPVELLEPL